MERRQMEEVKLSAATWILVDVLETGALGLLSVGNSHYPGSSVRKNLDQRARVLLMVNLRAAIEQGSPVDKIETNEGMDWRVVVEPIRSPTTGQTVAAHCIYAAPDAVLPPRPVIGALEWKIDPKTGAIDSEWDAGMYELYELVEDAGPSPTGDMTQWVNQFIAPEDQAIMKMTIDASISAHDGDRYIVSYRIKTGGNEGGMKILQVSGRVTASTHKESIWLRAITREIGSRTSTIMPEGLKVDTSGLLQALLNLTNDMIFFAVDSTTWQVFMPSPNLEGHGLAVGEGGFLANMIAPDDLQDCLAYLTKQLTATAPLASRGKFRFRTVPGNYVPMTVASEPFSTETDKGRYIACRLIREVSSR